MTLHPAVDLAALLRLVESAVRPAVVAASAMRRSPAPRRAARHHLEPLLTVLCAAAGLCTGRTWLQRSSIPPPPPSRAKPVPPLIRRRSSPAPVSIRTPWLEICPSRQKSKMSSSLTRLPQRPAGAALSRSRSPPSLDQLLYPRLQRRGRAPRSPAGPGWSPLPPWPPSSACGCPAAAPCPGRYPPPAVRRMTCPAPASPFSAGSPPGCRPAPACFLGRETFPPPPAACPSRGRPARGAVLPTEGHGAHRRHRSATSTALCGRMSPVPETAAPPAAGGPPPALQLHLQLPRILHGSPAAPAVVLPSRSRAVRSAAPMQLASASSSSGAVLRRAGFRWAAARRSAGLPLRPGRRSDASSRSATPPPPGTSSRTPLSPFRSASSSFLCPSSQPAHGRQQRANSARSAIRARSSSTCPQLEEENGAPVRQCIPCRTRSRWSAPGTAPRPRWTPPALEGVLLHRHPSPQRKGPRLVLAGPPLQELPAAPGGCFSAR